MSSLASFRRVGAAPAAVPSAAFASPVGVIASVIVGLFAAAPATAVEPSPATADVVATGRYLAAAAHCAACHTARADRPFAGNVPIESSLGTMYSSNITSDRKTGIGDWTLAQFTAALREGKGRHGEPLYPSMPYMELTKVSDPDVAALYAYFRSVPPIEEKTKKNEMKFPFNVRPGVAAWQALFFKPGRYLPDTSQTVEWNRGAYLVQGLGHCGACHSPRTKALSYVSGEALQGAQGQDYWYAPDISGSRFSGIRDWSVEQVRTYLKTGHNSKNVAAVGPMLQTVAEGTSKLADSDLQAMAVYLKNQPSPRKEEGQLPAKPLDAHRLESGAQLYREQCMGCHGDDGKGVDGIAPALAGNSALAGRGIENTARAVIQGFAPQGRWGGMPSFAQALSSQDIADVANWVGNAWGARSPAVETLSSINRLRMEVEPTIDPKAQQALVCPSVARSALDATTDEQVRALAARPGDAVVVPPRLLAGYRSRHPTVEPSAAITHLAGAYCRQLMTAGSGSYLERQSKLVAFTTRLAAQGAARR